MEPYAIRGGKHANDRSGRDRAHRDGVDLDLRRCRELVRDLSAGQYELRLFLRGGMHGHGARPGRILPTQSIPRDGVWRLCRELESPRVAQARYAWNGFFPGGVVFSSCPVGARATDRAPRLFQARAAPARADTSRTNEPSPEQVSLLVRWNPGPPLEPGGDKNGTNGCVGGEQAPYRGA